MFEVEKEKCIGCGLCVSIINEIFNFDDNGLAFVENQPNDSNLEKVIEAQQACPTEAIQKK